jgi:hypothetical protein
MQISFTSRGAASASIQSVIAIHEYSSNKALAHHLARLLHYRRQMRVARNRFHYSIIVGCALLAACGLPRDSDGALERARRDGLRVGVAHNPPWVRIDGAAVQGIEATLVTEIGRTAGARVHWEPGAESELLMKLKDRELDIVIAGLTDDLPWKTELGFTRVYYEDTVAKKKHVMAVAPGENALLMHAERTLLRQKDAVAALLRARTP